MNEIIAKATQLIVGAWRYRWWAFAAACAACVAGWLVVGLQPNVYEAKARVYVDTTSQLRLLLDDQIVESNVDDQLRYVREALLGRPQLERLARETGLDQGISHPEVLQALVDGLALTIQISSNSEVDPRLLRGNAPTDDTYTITYQHDNRATAVDVVSTLLDIFVQDTLGAKRTGSQAAGNFVASQIGEYEKRLRKAEERLADFKRRHIDRLPNMQGDYFERLQVAIDDLGSARQEMKLVESRLTTVQQQMRDGAPTMIASGTPDPNSIQARILENETRLDDLRLQYTDNHPDVIAASEIVEQLKRRQAEQLRDMTLSGGQGSNNPVFQALLISKNEIESELAKLRADVESRENRVEALRGLINEMPEVEAELARLNRDYDVIKSQYGALLNSLEREKLTREVAESEQVEFRVIDPPSAALQPVSPPRALMMLMVLAGSIGAGALLAHLMSEMRPVFHSGTALEKLEGIRVLGTVSRVLSEEVRKARFRSLAGFASAMSLLVLVNLAMLVFEVYGAGLRSYL